MRKNPRAEGWRTLAASSRASWDFSMEVTSALWAVPFHCAMLSNRPNLYICVRIRITESSIVAILTAPDLAAASSLLPMYWPPGISWSRPLSMDMLCVAPQSLITQPSKPARAL